MAKYYKARPNFAVPPGESILEMMENMGITHSDLALKLDITIESLDEIIKGKQPINKDIATNLEQITGVSSDLWLDLETGYKEQLRYLQGELKAEPNKGKM